MTKIDEIRQEIAEKDNGTIWGKTAVLHLLSRLENDLKTEKDEKKIEYAEYMMTLCENDIECNLKRLHTNKEIDFIKQIGELQ